MVEDTQNQQTDRVSAAAVLQFAAHEARQGRRFAEFGAHAFASITYNAYGIQNLFLTKIVSPTYNYSLTAEVVAWCNVERGSERKEKRYRCRSSYNKISGQ